MAAVPSTMSKDECEYERARLQVEFAKREGDALYREILDGLCASAHEAARRRYDEEAEVEEATVAILKEASSLLKWAPTVWGLERTWPGSAAWRLARAAAGYDDEGEVA